jgi:hypothetical protein
MPGTNQVSLSNVRGPLFKLLISYAALAAFAASMYHQTYLYLGFVGLTVFGWLRIVLHHPFPRENQIVRFAVAGSIIGAFFSPFVFRFFSLTDSFTSIEEMLRFTFTKLSVLGAFAAGFWIWRDLIIVGVITPLRPEEK